MRCDVITLFPEMFAPMQHSIMGRAQKSGLLEFNTLYLRNFAINDYGQVDDRPFGGEPGMVLRPEPLAKAIDSTGAKQNGGKVVYLSADGVPFSHKIAQELSQESHLVFVCGHYKGIDQRIRDSRIDMEISIGDYVLSGGELAAMVVIDAAVRLIPGVLNDIGAAETDSFAQGLLGWPVYTRPEIFEEKQVPPVLLSGHHKNIQVWLKEQSLRQTALRRPELLEKVILNDSDRRILKSFY